METLLRIFIYTLILSFTLFGDIIYTNPEPDITIDAYNVSQGSMAGINVDLNQDSILDLNFFPDSSSIWIGPTTGQAYTLGKTINSGSIGWDKTIVDSISLNKTILVTDSNWTGGHAPIEKDGIFDGLGDKYLGLKLRDDNKVGWMRVNVAWPIITIKDYAIEDDANVDIVAGDKGTTPILNDGISKVQASISHNFGPNIMSNSLEINAPQNNSYSIELFNISGKKIIEFSNITLNKGVNKISLGNKTISNGYILLKVMYNNSTIIKGFYRR